MGAHADSADPGEVGAGDTVRVNVQQVGGHPVLYKTQRTVKETRKEGKREGRREGRKGGKKEGRPLTKEAKATSKKVKAEKMLNKCQ